MFAINCLNALTRVRRRVADANANIFSDAVILEALDESLGYLFSQVRMSGQDYDYDLIASQRTAWASLGNQIIEYTLPETVREVVNISGQTASGAEVEFLKAHVEERNYGRVPITGRPVWFFSKQARPGRIEVRGQVTPFPVINIRYVRAWAPLHYGTAAAGGADSLTFPAAGIGRIIPRPDVYTGMDVEITADTEAANVGALGRVASYSGVTRVATFDAPWPAATSAATSYAIVVPLDPEHVDYLVEEAAYDLFSRLGEVDQLATMEPRLARLRDRFAEAINARHSAEPKRLYAPSRVARMS